MRNKLTSLKYTGMLFHCNNWWSYIDGKEFGPHPTDASAYYNLRWHLSIDRLTDALLKAALKGKYG